VWHKFRWHCAEPTCPGGSWTEDEPRIPVKRLMLSHRAGRWVTEPVGRHARTVNEIAVELGCDWHPINDTVVAYGAA
jgi:transposase